MALGKEMVDRLTQSGSLPDREQTLALESDGVRVELDLHAADSLGASFTELRLHARRLENAGLDALRAWARRVCDQITYLLERVEPLEADADAGTVLVRSMPPAKRAAGTSYYEAVVARDGWMRFKRYRVAPPDPRRTAVPCTFTHEQLERLIDDLTASVE